LEKLSQLISQIKKLSPDSRTRLGQYIEFLQWQEARRQAQATTSWSFSFIEAYGEAFVTTTEEPAGLDVKMAPAMVGGENRPALWAHPPVTGQAIIEFHVPVPQQVSDIQLSLAIGIRDGSQISENNLVAFGVMVNGLRVWGQQTNERRWIEAGIPLDLVAGDIVRVEFTTEALGRHEWTWAVWGGPELTGKFG
jgi:hypothetical protein